MEGQVLTQTPATSRSGSTSARGGRLPDWRGLGYAPFLWSALACLVLAAISAAILPTVPSYDPWAWISWGREVTDPHLSFAISGGPSWKPLPVMFTTIYALFGSAAPTLWVITARAGGFLGMVAAYLLASRLVSREGRGPRWAAVAAGLIAAVGIVVTQAYWDEMFRGTSEPMEIAPRCGRCWPSSTAGAGGRSCSGGHGAAPSRGVASDHRLRPVAVVEGAAAAGGGRTRSDRSRSSGSSHRGGVGAAVPGRGPRRGVQRRARPHPLFGVLGRGINIQLLPVLLAGLVAVVFAWFDKPRDWLVSRSPARPRCGG